MSTQSWSAHGTYTWQVPAGVTSLAVDVVGAAAGISGSRPPRPGRVTGTLVVTPGEILTIVVGGQGQGGTGTGSGAGGYNGGGAGGTAAPGFSGGWGGSGASDVRQGGSGLANRKVVAGGAGGSSGSFNNSDGGWGGAPPITNGAGQGLFGGQPGTASAGGAAGSVSTGCTAGTSGQGGHGANNAVQDGGGGGGGGYWGGGGGGETNSGGSAGLNNSGGGGGSNYAAGLTGTVNSITQNTFGDGAVTFTYNTAPNASILTDPANGANVDLTTSTLFGWVFSDPDPGDTQGSANFRWRVGAGAWTTVTGFSPDFHQTATTAANAWLAQSGVSVEWQIQTVDSNGLAGPWSASSFFTPRTPPTAPTIAPTPVINSNTVSVTATHGTSFNAMEARAVNDIAGSPGTTVLADVGNGSSFSSVTSWTWTLPPYAYVNGTAYHIQARIASPSGVWGPWADSGAIVCTIGAAPLAPTAVVTADPASAAVAVAITNPGSDPHPPNHNDVYRTDLTRNTAEQRIATNVPINRTFIDYLAPSNTVLRYRVVAVTSTGGSASSP